MTLKTIELKYDIIGVMGRCQKGLLSQNLLFFKEFVLILLSFLRVFHKKSKFLMCHI